MWSLLKVKGAVVPKVTRGQQKMVSCNVRRGWQSLVPSTMSGMQRALFAWEPVSLVAQV